MERLGILLCRGGLRHCGEDPNDRVGMGLRVANADNKTHKMEFVFVLQ